MKKPPHLLVISLCLALSSAVAQTDAPTVTPALTPAQQSAAAKLNTIALVDVPADHWALEAIKMMTLEGYVTGFPDGTFRGNLPLTRYQAAVILTRMMTEVDTLRLTQEQRAVLQRGLDSVREEINVLQAQLVILSSSVTAQADALAAAQAQQKADTARITTLEAQVAEFRAQLTAVTAALATTNGNYDALRAQQAEAMLGRAAPAAAAPASSPLPDVAQQPDVTFTPKADVPAQLSNPQLAAGIQGALGGPSTTVGAVVDYLPDPQGGFGLQAHVASALGEVKYTTLGLNTSYAFGRAGSDLRPYVYGGVGATMSEAWKSTANVTDVFARAGIGVEYRMASTVALFGDGYANYYFTNRGLATGLPEAATSGPSFGARFGVKFRF